MILSVYEILANCDKLETEQERVDNLLKNNSNALRTMLQGAFDSRIVWLVPEGAPTYNENDLPDQEGRLHAKARELYLFVKGSPDLPPLKRETLFVQMLESLDKNDAKLLLCVKEKRMPPEFTNITPSLVNLAFPGLIK